MMSNYYALNVSERKQFDLPPLFNSSLRKKFLRLSKKAKGLLKTIDNNEHKICFALLLGYFEATHKFYTPNAFSPQDIEYVARLLGIFQENYDLTTIHRQTLYRYRNQILEYYSCASFGQISKEKLYEQAVYLASKQSKPRKIFFSLVEYLRQKKIEIPSFRILSNMIGKALLDYEELLHKKLQKEMTMEQKEILGGLLEKNDISNMQKSRHFYVFLKEIEQGLKPGQIKAHILSTEYLRTIVDANQSLISQLSMGPSVIENYASWVKRSKSNQVHQKEPRSRYLHLLCFSIHQYFQHHDALVYKFLSSVNSAKNTAQKTQNQWLLEQQESQIKNTDQIIHHARHQETAMRQIYEIVTSDKLPLEEKISKILNLFESRPRKEPQAINNIIKSIESFNQKAQAKALFYEALEKGSRRLQNRVSGILQALRFNPKTCESNLYQAIEHFCKHQGNIDRKAPQQFLKPEASSQLFDAEGKFRVSLYKVLLFMSVSHGIKSGSLNLLDTHVFKSFEEYLIDKEVWERDREVLLGKAGLSGFRDIETFLPQLKLELASRYKRTNEQAMAHENPHIRFKKNGGYHVQTPALEHNESLNLSDVFPQQKYISLQEILGSVQAHSQYLSVFEHHNRKYVHQKPSDAAFYAGIMGYGCQIGIPKMEQISTGIEVGKIDSVVNGYFSLENLQKSNNKVLQFIQTLDLPELFKKDEERLHTSSDGQKYEVKGDSIHANRSFKYFGQGKGVSVYTFIDERHLLFHSNVISSSEREAAWVIDGLLHNEVVKSDIHSTDTHGYTEIIFGSMHLLGYEFAPRIKKFNEQRLYTFSDYPAKNYREKGYQILPSKKYINEDLIKEHWDDILRFIVTIKLKQSTASQLFKRLTSYARENTLYKALKNFGQIFKTLFILKYIDEVELRKDVEKQLNKIESVQRFSKAVQVSNNQEMSYQTKEEQELAATSKRLIQNCIVCWNYLYLSDYLSNSEQKEQLKILEMIKQGSIVHWKHVNFNGMYDFSEERQLKNSQFNLAKIKAWKTPENWAR